ncbi:ROK family protein [Gallibacterium anatis]|uniref:ROK family protein n=1 Tax=Gallibacterium anatis TaxID=750 RepID=UPI0039FC7ACA
MKKNHLMEYYVGIDIRGTNTKIGIVDNHCNILIEHTIKTLSIQGAQQTFARIWLTVQDMANALNISTDQLLGIGLGIPGLVVNQAIISRASNFSWGDNFNAKQLMEDISQKFVKVEKDVNNIALGELLFGSGRGFNNIIVISIGTGLSAGIILDKKLLSGVHGCAGEFGHIVVNEKGLKCGCGLTGCLETYASATGILRETKRLILEKKVGLLSEQFYHRLSDLEVSHIFDFYNKNDEIAIEVIENFCKYLAYGLGVLLNTVDPELVILAGGVSKSADLIIQKVKIYLTRYALSASLEKIQMKRCQLLDSAGIKGAASLVINDYRHRTHNESNIISL